MRYFIDTEFDGYMGPLLSLALIREDGRSLHFYDPEVEAVAQDPWVLENVIPILKDCPDPPSPRHRASAARAVAQFLAGDEAPHIVADWPDDIRHFCDLMITGPGEMIEIPGVSFEVKRVDAYPSSLESPVQHNAWWDALALRQKVLEMEEGPGRAEPPPAETACSFKSGDLVSLRSGGAPLTVAAVSPFAEVDDTFAVDVLWQLDDGQIHEARVPHTALVRVSG